MTDPTLHSLDAHTPFADRHIGLRADDVATMLERIGYASVEDLMAAAVPSAIRSGVLDLPAAVSEQGAAAELRSLAARNRPAEPMIGLGYHGTITPPVIRRNVLEDPSWYTAYTPYQPEISQGRLEALLNFQTVVADLAGLPTANASLLDEATAAAEAMTLVRRANRKATGPFVVDADTLPQTIEVVRTRAEAMGIDVVVADLDRGSARRRAVRAAACRTPARPAGSSTRARSIEAAHERDALVVVAADLLALTLLEAPGALGADVVDRFLPALRRAAVLRRPARRVHGGRRGPRAAPARSPGRGLASTSRAGRPTAWPSRPASSTSAATRRPPTSAPRRCCWPWWRRCTPSTTAPRACGPSRPAPTATPRCIAAALREGGLEVEHGAFFDTLTVRVPGRGRAGRRRRPRPRAAPAAGRRRPRRALDVGDHDAGRRRERARGLRRRPRTSTRSTPPPATRCPTACGATTPYLTHEVFSTHRTETQMLRYLRRLSARDYALDRGMIPLGSCTMKLNATTEMEPVSLPGFADLHPFAPAEDTLGYQQLVGDLEGWLAEVTGYDRVSIQPNAGSQGELAGLLAIRGYHRANGGEARNVCLIPSSAHGTNAASAVMAGMKVVVVKAAADGSVDLDDLRAQCEAHRDDLAAIMVTYPSTHGVYEDTISELCEIVHEHGGQVYVDGANLNALLGYARPGKFGGDVSHLNLHKTFCIPHGGGGPGVGPVGVREHLAPYLPSHPMHPEPAKREGIGPISAAPYGSAGILPISWAYVRLMGAEGLTRATASAVLAANYVAARLGEHYPVLYQGQDGLVAHECILDVRGLTKDTGVSVDDVAKRLVDYGFHAPTMSFPVAGTLMVEPTESEDLGEIDRFCDAMIAIKAEIDRVGAGEWSAEDSPLRNAPHTTRALIEKWERPYERELGVFPAGQDPDKYWPPVARIDQAYGDRNLVCSCPPIEAFAE